MDGSKGSSPRGSIAYFVLAAVLVVFGALTGLSLGVPFLLTGVLMIALSPSRRRPEVFWPALVAVWAFVLGYLLVGPLGCASSLSGTAGSPPAVSHTTCTNLLGINYSGTGTYSPSLVPAFLAGAAAAVVGAVVTRLLIVRGRRPPAPV